MIIEDNKTKLSEIVNGECFEYQKEIWQKSANDPYPARENAIVKCIDCQRMSDGYQDGIPEHVLVIPVRAKIVIE